MPIDSNTAPTQAAEKQALEQQAVELLTAIADQDRSAMERFYRLLEPNVYRFVMVRLNDPDMATDIVNTTMLEVWRHAGRFAGRSKVSTWLLGIAHHKVQDHYRKKRVQDEPLEAHQDHLPDQSASSETLLQRAQDAQSVHDALAALPAAQRELLHLAFFEELPYREIASIIGVPEGTVKSRVYHAKAALAKHLSTPDQHQNPPSAAAGRRRSETKEHV